MAGRGTHEQVYLELKTGFAFGSVPNMQSAANSAWQCLSVPAVHLSRSFQLATTASRRGSSRKRRTPFAVETIRALRALCVQRAGLFVAPHGTATFDVGTAPGVADRFRRLARVLAT